MMRKKNIEEKILSKKWQFDYNNETCFNNDYPEINYKDEVTNCVNVAPGEGKIPSNILEEIDWDIKSFPCLLPDGKNSLHSERKIKIKEQDYFNQRILNKDPRFAETAAFVFAAVTYLEQKQINRNTGISFIRGKVIHRQTELECTALMIHAVCWIT